MTYYNICIIYDIPYALTVYFPIRVACPHFTPYISRYTKHAHLSVVVLVNFFNGMADQSERRILLKEDEVKAFVDKN